jgi:hypothetical protein
MVNHKMLKMSKENKRLYLREEVGMAMRKGV